MLPRRRLSPRLVVSLNAARALAAFYVVLQHIGKTRGWDQGWLGIPVRFGQEAVLVFFVLSGFLIFASEYRPEGLRTGYTLRRLRRIYPALLVALVLSTLVIWDNGDLTTRFSLGSLLGTLAGLQDVSFLKPGVITDVYLNNDPLWSLSYELFFYAMFPLVASAWRRAPRQTDHAIGAICCAAYALFAVYPNHWLLVVAYFMTWWVGAMAANAYLNGHRSVSALRSPLLWLCGLIAVSVGVTIEVGARGTGYYPLLMTRHFTVALVLMLIFFSQFGGWLADRIERFSRGTAFLASLSYGVYVFHLPLLVQWKRAQTIEGFVMAMVLMLGAAFLFDRQLNKWLATPAANRLIGRLELAESVELAGAAINEGNDRGAF